MRHLSRLLAAAFAASLLLPAAISPALAAADHLQFTSTPGGTAGSPVTVSVQAQDTLGVGDPGYTGSIVVTTDDPGATVGGATATLDPSVFDFTITFHLAGTRSLTASDGTLPDGHGSLSVTAGATATLAVSGYPGSTITGVSHNVTVTTQDPFGNTDTGYLGTVTISTDDLAATHGPDATLTAGVGTFAVTFNSAGGPFKITATDTSVASITGSQTGITAAAPPISQLVVSGFPSPTIAGQAHPVTVTAEDSPGHTDTSYGGTVHITSSDGAAVLPLTDLTLVAGVGSTSVALQTVGVQSITATDIAPGGAHQGSQGGIDVRPAAASLFVVDQFPSPAQAGSSHPVRVTARDPFGNTDTSYAGMVHITSNDPMADLPGDGTLISGVGMFSVTLHSLGLSRSITASDGGIGGTQSGIVVQAGPPPPDVPPTASGDAYVVRQGATLSVDSSKGVLANDVDVDSPHSSLTAHVDTTTSHGTLHLAADGSFTYTPTSGYIGSDSFTYHANDGSLDSGTVGVSLTVYLNHPPIAINDVLTVVAGSPATFVDVLANDNAINQDAGEPITLIAIGRPAHGAVAIAPGGTGILYRPASGFVGTDLFSYTITDGQFQATGRVLVKVPKDTFGPKSTAPVPSVPGQSLGSATVLVRLAWSATDLGVGVAKYEVQLSRNGGAYSPVTLSSSLATSANRTLDLGSTYRVRVRATDKLRNVGSWVYGSSFRVVQSQENAATFLGTWSTSRSSSYSAGIERSTAAVGAAATFTATGRTLAWVTDRGSTRGLVEVFVDGVLATTLNLALPSTVYRYVAFSRTFSSSAAHTLKIVYVGLPANRIAVDAFIVLR